MSADMLLLLLLVSASGPATSANSLADQFLDSILNEPIEREIKNLKLDPAQLPAFGLPFKINLGPVPISGRVDYDNGVFNGLSKIRRLMSCQGPNINLQDIRLECGLNFFGMSASYDGKTTVERFPPIPFSVIAYVNETTAKSVMSGAPASFKGQLKLLEVTKFGDINVKLTNLGIFQYVYDYVEERFRDRVREELTSIILGEFVVAFGKAITQVRLPGLGFSDDNTT